MFRALSETMLTYVIILPIVNVTPDCRTYSANILNIVIMGQIFAKTTIIRFLNLLTSSSLFAFLFIS